VPSSKNKLIIPWKVLQPGHHDLLDVTVAHRGKKRLAAINRDPSKEVPERHKEEFYFGSYCCATVTVEAMDASVSRVNGVPNPRIKPIFGDLRRQSGQGEAGATCSEVALHAMRYQVVFVTSVKFHKLRC